MTNVCFKVFYNAVSCFGQLQILPHVNQMANTMMQQWHRQQQNSGPPPHCHALVGILVLIFNIKLFFSSKHVPKMWLLIATSCFFFSFFLEDLCLELSRAIEAGDTQAASQHASALAGQKAALTIQLSEKNYADGEIKWEMNSVDVCSRLLCTIKAYVASFLLQFICCSGGCFLVSVRHRQGFSLHDSGCSQATGQKTHHLTNRFWVR